MISSNKKNAKIFKAFCDEKRLAILSLLGTGERCACDIIDFMDIGQSAVSYHMKILTEANIVSTRQQGKWTYYKLSKEGSEEALHILAEITKLDN